MAQTYFMTSSASNQTVSKGLTSLPVEIQLMIVRAWLVTDTPIINFATAKSLADATPSGWPLGQTYLSLSILWTCQAYHVEGWKIFWQRNHFVISRRTADVPAIQHLFFERPMQPHEMLRDLTLHQSNIQTLAESLLSTSCHRGSRSFAISDRLETHQDNP